MGDDEMKFEDLDEAETIYPLSTDSAKKAVELLKNHYFSIIYPNFFGNFAYEKTYFTRN